MIALMQTNEVIKFFIQSGKPLINKILIYNAMDNSQFIMNLKPSFSIDKIKEIYLADSYYDARCEVQDKKLIISAADLKKRINDDHLQILSVINNSDVHFPFRVDQKIPLSKLNTEQFQPDPAKDLIVVCHKGITSYKATKLIKQKYPELNVLSLQHGIDHY